MKHTCIIIDDEPDARALIAHHLQAFPQIEVLAQCGHVDQAITEIIEQQPDILFLDIQMPARDGFDLLSELRELNVALPKAIIFTTAFNQYAIKAFKFAAFDYLLKPINKEEFGHTIHRVLADDSKLTSKMERFLEYANPENKLRINTRTGFLLINVNEIIYCKADGNYTEIYTEQNRKEVATMNLSKTAHLLQSHPQFQRIGRSCLINRNYLYSVDRAKRQIILRKEHQDILLAVPEEYLGKLG